MAYAAVVRKLAIDEAGRHGLTRAAKGRRGILLKHSIAIIALSLMASVAIGRAAEPPTAAEIETSRQRAQSLWEQYRSCLATQTLGMQSRKPSARDAFDSLRRACSAQARQLRTTAAVFLTMTHPEMPAKAALAGADHEIALARADAVKGLVELKRTPAP
jgi:hypothetical protein